MNHFISSTASQLVAPFISSLGAGSGVETWMAKIVRLLSNEVKHRVNQLGYFGLIPRPIQVLLERQ